jgi:hypothetical protein
MPIFSDSGTAPQRRQYILVEACAFANASRYDKYEHVSLTRDDSISMLQAGIRSERCICTASENRENLT